MSSAGMGKLVEVQEHMNAEQSADILREGVVETFLTLKIKKGERIFQQDNDPKQGVSKVKRSVPVMGSFGGDLG
jgi:hypothetical protein